MLVQQLAGQDVIGQWAEWPYGTDAAVVATDARVVRPLQRFQYLADTVALTVVTRLPPTLLRQCAGIDV
jgi:hypothetical protein